VTGGSLSFTGADQSTGIGAVTRHDSGGSNATAWTVTVSPTTSGNMVAAFMCDGSGATTVTAGTSRFIDVGSGAGAAGFSAAGTAPSTGSGVAVGGAMGSDFNAVLGFEVLAASGAVGSGAAVLASGAGAAQTAGTSPHNAFAGPAYAATATDLGGVYGSWATPQFATGGP
jgi:hypothetical protein